MLLLLLLLPTPPPPAAAAALCPFVQHFYQPPFTLIPKHANVSCQRPGVDTRRDLFNWLSVPDDACMCVCVCAMRSLWPQAIWHMRRMCDI